MNRLLLVVFSAAVAACATPETQVDRTAPVPLGSSTAAEPAVSAAVPASVSGPTAGELAEPTAPDGSGQYAINESGIDNDGIEDDSVGGIREVEAPQPLETPAEMIPRPVVESPIVCTWEVPTGSRLRVKVCRDRAYMERKQEQDQDIFSDIKTRTAINAGQL
jgi:hypothetical protein